MGHPRQRRVAPLFFEAGEVHAGGGDARGCAGFEPAGRHGQGAQPFRQGVGRRVAGAPASVIFHADVDAAAEERPGGQHHRVPGELEAHRGSGAADAAGGDVEVHHRLLEDVEVVLAFQDAPDGGPVERPVRLCAGGPHGWALARVQHAELDAGRIGGERHRAA